MGTFGIDLGNSCLYIILVCLYGNGSKQVVCFCTLNRNFRRMILYSTNPQDECVGIIQHGGKYVSFSGSGFDQRKVVVSSTQLILLDLFLFYFFFQPYGW